MPVLGVASKLRQPAGGSKPVHTALPIPSLGPAGSQQYSPKSLGLTGAESSMLSCQLTLKPTCTFGERRGLQGKTQEMEDSKIYTDWANHYLAKSGHKRLIKDLQQDIADGVLLAEIIQIIANEKVEAINGCPRSQSQMIENVDVCLSFLAARGVNVQGLSAEEIRNGNLKAILGLFFSLSRYKQQQHQQQQYYQSLVELQQQVPSPPVEISQSKTHQDMQSSLTARYATQSNHSGIATSQKKTSRLPGPSRVPAAGSSTKVQGASNLNRRSQSFNSIDKNKPPQYANGNEKADSPKGPHPSAGMNGNVQHPTSTGQQQVSAIPSPSASKPWRSKSMNVKHSATSTMLSVKQPSPATSPTPSSERLKPPPSEGIKPPSSGQKSMLEKFKLVNARTALRPPLSLSSGPSDSGREDDTFSECGEMEVLSSGVNSGGSTSSSPKVSPKLAPPKAGSKNLSNKKSLLQPKDKEEKNRDKTKVCTEKTVKEEKDQVTEASTKKSSKIASLIPKGNKTAAAKKESLIPSSSGIPKPGSKVPTAKQSASSGCTGSKELDKLRTTKGNQSQSTPKSQLNEKASPSSALASSEGKEPSAAAPTGSSAPLPASMSASSGQGTGNGAVHLPQQQQYSHPNTATVAPFIYRTLSENDSSSLPPADSCTSPTKLDLSFSKTAKQCLEEISGEDPETRRMRTVKNIADLRQNLEETMSSLRGTQISHSTLETTFDSTVTTEVNGRSIPSLTGRSTPVTWRLGQASPRLQAGDAPSLGAGYPRSGTSRFMHTDPSRFMYTTPLRRAAVSRLGNISQLDMSEKGGGDLDMASEVDVGGYMSDGDILGKSLRADDINSGYMTDGGLNLYTRSLNRIPDLTASRDIIQRGVHDVTVDADRICECTEAEAEIILQLKSELREKELKLTDIRLEALSSAHHLDQIREAMNRMQNEIEILKAENDRLKAETGNTGKPARPSSESSSSTSSSSSRQSLGLSLNNLNITESVTSDILLDDATDGAPHKEGHSVKILVTINKGYGRAKDQKPHTYLIGSIGVSGKTKWDVLDGVIRRLFKEYIFRVDPTTSLGLSSDCIASYCIGDIIRGHSLEVPELLPCGYLVGDNNIITVNLKGVEENSLDSFVFDTLIPKPITQRYFNLLMEHRRIILSGPSGTGKTYLANRLAEYVITKSGRKKTEDAIATFNVDHKSSKDLRQYLANLAEQCSADNNGADLPVVIILDNLHHISSLSDIFNGFLNCKYNKCPYIIGTMNQGVSSSPNLELHHNFRWVLCANHTEPVKGFLGRYLRRKLIETEIEKNMRNNELMKIIDWIPKTWHHLNSFLETHSSSDVTIGPRLFLPCPMDVDGSRVWFTDLWNYSLVPYLLEAVREGLQMYGKRAPWEDPSKWVADTYPWSSASLQHEWPSLLHLRPEDVGYEGYASAKEGTTSKHVPQNDTEGDPLMNMLMRLQEAANYSSAQSCDSDSTSHHDDILDSSLESAL
ncbi:neuron navigator 3 [Melanerpes formicivorus]|uniref:neuron navigator 3 n=1 Tax=Melanerpes formicivorus TaxID=211600 RepID=UPI00358ED193